MDELELDSIAQDAEEISHYQSVRYKAVKLLSRYERSDAYIDKLLDYEMRETTLNSLDKSLLTEIVNGTIRWRAKIDWVLNGFYRGDYQKCLNIVKNALRVGLYQILFLNKIPIHAAVDESVEIVKRIQGEKTAGIVNGVLRNISRNIPNIRYPEREEDLVYYFSVIYSHPKWMIKRWLERFGESATENLLYANNKRPLIPIRVNLLKTSVEAVIDYLKENNIIFLPSSYLANGIHLKLHNLDITSMEIFKKGFISIQDTSASLAAMLCAPQPGSTVIDLCAAPGGKSFLLAESMNDSGKIIAIDKYKSKLNFIEEGAARLGHHIIHTLAEDARVFEYKEGAECVLVDAPCTGLGTLAKKPDIKWKREIEDVINCSILQKEILDNAAKLVIPGGTLVYSTCSMEPEENTDIVNWFLESHPEFSLEPAEKYLPAEVCKDGFMQTFPHLHEIDGAYAARMIKSK
ncbi:MAG: Ribosomal small subunit methyltransferase [Ignavibacteria bacterium]|nr:Ribosomal small subunit methyltransferase [Ignavibacteria bacterium]